MAVKYLAGNRLWGTNAERTGMTTATYGDTTWKVLAKDTVTGTARPFDTGTSSAFYTNTRDNLMILVHYVPTGGSASDVHFRFNNDGDSNKYAGTTMINDDTGSVSNTAWNSTNKDKMTWIKSVGSNATQIFLVGEMRNKQTHTASGNSPQRNAEKMIYLQSAQDDQSGANGTYLHRVEGGWKWVSSALVNRIESTANVGVGSELIVLGHDDDESDNTTPTASAWEYLGGVTVTSGTETTITTPTFTAKKYYMVKAWVIGNSDMQFRPDGSTSDLAYAYQGNFTYGGNSGSSSVTKFWSNYSDMTGGAHINGFIVNSSSMAKLGLADIAEHQGTAFNDGDSQFGCSEWIGKWNTNTQMTSLNLTAGSGNLGQYTILQVWGFNP
jgi:hypothetical protein